MNYNENKKDGDQQQQQKQQHTSTRKKTVGSRHRSLSTASMRTANTANDTLLIMHFKEKEGANDNTGCS